MSVCNSIYIKAQTMAANAGMEFDPIESRWVAARGRFEGEKWYAPYFWDCVLNGDGESVDSGQEESAASADILQVDADESEAFWFDCGSWILVRQDSQGFVMVTNHKTRKEAETRARQWFGC